MKADGRTFQEIWDACLWHEAAAKPLSALKDLPWADVLDEDICQTVEWVTSLKDLNWALEQNLEVEMWLWDLRFMLQSAHEHMK